MVGVRLLGSGHRRRDLGDPGFRRDLGDVSGGRRETLSVCPDVTEHRSGRDVCTTRLFGVDKSVGLFIPSPDTIPGRGSVPRTDRSHTVTVSVVWCRLSAERCPEGNNTVKGDPRTKGRREKTGRPFLSGVVGCVGGLVVRVRCRRGGAFLWTPETLEWTPGDLHGYLKTPGRVIPCLLSLSGRPR